VFRFACHSIIIWLCLAININALAQDGCRLAVYAVTDMHLDETAATGTLAREQAIAAATRNAFNILVRRMLVPGQPAAEIFDGLNSADFVDFIHIDNENALPQRYIADIDICFDAARVRSVLMQNNFKWSELNTPQILFLPVWQDPSGVRAWTKNTLWLESWRQLDSYQDRLLQFTFLDPELSLERQLDPQGLMAADSRLLRQAALASNAAQIALLYAGLDYSRSDPQLRMRASLYDADGSPLTEVLEREVALNGQTSMPAAFDSFQQDVLAAIENSWRLANLYVAGAGDEIYVTVPVSSPERWYHIQALLSEMAVVSDVSAHSLSAQRGVLRLRLSGPVEALQLAVRPTGYRLDSDTNGYLLSVSAN